MLFDRIAATPNTEAYRFPVGDRWESVTWHETGETVRTLAAGLLALGIRPEERVAIASSTRIEWLYVDLAIACSGAATTTVYPSTEAADVGFILVDSGSRIAFVEDDVQVEKLRGQRDRLPDLKRVIIFDGTADGDWVLDLDDLRDLAAPWRRSIAAEACRDRGTVERGQVADRRGPAEFEHRHPHR